MVGSPAERGTGAIVGAGLALPRRGKQRPYKKLLGTFGGVGAGFKPAPTQHRVILSEAKNLAYLLRARMPSDIFVNPLP